MTVEHVMTKNVICCVPTNTAQEAAQLMARHSIGALPVITAPHQAFLGGIVTDRICVVRCSPMPSPRKALYWRI